MPILRTVVVQLLACVMRSSVRSIAVSPVPDGEWQSQVLYAGSGLATLACF